MISFLDFILQLKRFLQIRIAWRAQISLRIQPIQRRAEKAFQRINNDVIVGNMLRIEMSRD